MDNAGTNWNRNLVRKAHSRAEFCSDPVRSHAYFPEWKLAINKWRNPFDVLLIDIGYLGYNHGKKLMKHGWFIPNNETHPLSAEQC